MTATDVGGGQKLRELIVLKTLLRGVRAMRVMLTPKGREVVFNGASMDRSR